MDPEFLDEKVSEARDAVLEDAREATSGINIWRDVGLGHDLLKAQIDLLQVLEVKKLLESESGHADLLTTLSRPGLWWTKYTPIQQEAYEQLLTKQPQDAMDVGHSEERLLMYLAKESCSWNPWVKIYTTLDKVDWRWDSSRMTPIADLAEAKQVLARFVKEKPNNDGILLSSFRVIEMHKEQVALFEAQMVENAIFCSPPNATYADKKREEFMKEIKALSEMHQKSIFINKRKWAMIRLALTLISKVNKDHSQVMVKEYKIGTTTAWKNARYAEVYETVTGSVNALRLRAVPVPLDKSTKTVYKRKGRPEPGEIINDNAEKKKETDDTVPNATAYLVALGKWLDKSPNETTEKTFELPAYANDTVIGQNLRPFLAELLQLSLFAYHFDRCNSSKDELTFFKNYLLMECDLTTEDGKQRWQNEFFEDKPLRRILHCPFILICSRGYVVCSYKKRSKPFARILDALVCWRIAINREPCKAVLHSGHKVKWSTTPQ